MLKPGPTKKMIIYVNQSALYQGKPLYEVILRFLHRAGCAKAIANRCIAGFETDGVPNTFGDPHLTEDLPVRIEVLESAETIEALLPSISDMVTDGLIELQDTQIIKYAHKPEVKAAPDLHGVKLQGNAMMLRIYVDQTDRYEGQPLSEAIIKRLKMADIAGATVFKGTTGYGAKSRVHRKHLLVMGDNPPVMITVVDTEERIRQVLPMLGDMVEEGLVVLSEVDVVKYSHIHDDEDRTIVPR